MARVTVSKLAELVGISPDTIRYYERAALLPAPERTAAGYRLYGEETADRLRFIKGAKRLGLRLREIRELLEVVDRGLCPCGHAETLLRRRIAEIEEEIVRLAQLKAELTRVVDQFPAEECSDGPASWPCRAEIVRAANGKERADAGR